MIDTSRRTVPTMTVFFSLIPLVGFPTQAKASLKVRKRTFETKRIANTDGYYGFSETW